MPIISNKYKFIFIHIPKTGGSSVAEALGRIDSSIYVRKSLVSYKNVPINLETTQVYYWGLRPRLNIPKHSKAIDIKKSIGTKKWNQFFKFAFVRNPWDLMVSSYFWWKQLASSFPALLNDCKIIQNMDFTTFMRSKYGNDMINECEGSLFDWISDEEGKIIVDYAGKLENIQDDFNKICEKISVRSPRLKHLNITKRKDYREYYDEESRIMVEKRFKRTIEYFKYQF